LPTLAYIALRYIKRHKVRNIFTVLTILIGVALVIGVNVTFDSVIAQYQATANKATGNVDITITSLEETFNQTVLSEVQSVYGVVDASARLSRQAELVGKNATETVLGVDSASDFEFQGLNFSIRDPSKDLTMNGTGLVVSSSLNFSLGGTIQIQFYDLKSAFDTSSALKYQPNEKLTDPYNFSVTATYVSRRTQIYADLTKIQNLCNLTGKIDTINVKISSYELTDQIVNALNEKLGSTFVVSPVKQDRLASIEETTGGLTYGLEIVSIIALCVSIVVVLNSMYVNVGEMTREIGILRSIGSSRQQVFWIFFSQSLILGLIGAVIGIGAGVLLTSVFKLLVNLFLGHIYTSQELSTLFDSSYVPYILMGAVAGIVTTLIGGVFPSLSASRVEIIRSLRPTMRKPGKQKTALKLIGLGLPLTIFGIMEYFGYFSYSGTFEFLTIFLLIPVIGVVFLVAGIIRLTNRGMGTLLFMFRSCSKIISRNIDRNLLKSTACFTMIGLSLSFLIVIGGVQIGVVTGIEDVVKSYVSCDVTVIADSNLSRTFSQNVTAIDNEQLISRATSALVVPEKTILINNASGTKTSVKLIAVDPETYSAIMPMMFSKESPVDVFDKLNSSGSIILTAPLALSLNVSVNDKLQLPTVEASEVSVSILNPALTNFTQSQIAQYQALGKNITATITVKVPQVEVTYHNFTIVGIAQGALMRVASFSQVQLDKACYISYNSLNDIYPAHKDSANLFFAEAKSSQDIETAKQQLESLYGTMYNLEIITRNQIVDNLKGDIDSVFVSLYVPVLFAALNAVIGTFSITVMNVNARRREIGILKSQGMSRSQIVVSVVGEVLVLGSIGFVVALILGVIFQSIVVEFMNLSGFIMPFKISVSSVEIALFEALAISTLSAVYPAYRASKLDIVNSLRAT
jgi:putative ABC transport system permease protein